MNEIGKSTVLLLLLLSFLPAAVGAKTLPPNFKVTNEMIYQKLIEIEKRQVVFEERFKQIDRRFEQVDKRFEQHFKYIELMVIGMFGLVATFVGLLLWDRKTMIGEAKRQIYEEMDSEVRPEKLKRLLKSLREIAKVDKRIAEILKKEGLL